MQWKNTEIPTFAGSDGNRITGPDVVETMQLLDRNGAVVATFTKQVDGSFAFTTNASGVGITSSAPVNTIPVTVDGEGNLGASQITETAGRDNVPVLSGGNYDADFFSPAETGFLLAASAVPGGSYTPNGLSVVVETGYDNSTCGALIGARDTQTANSSGSTGALNLDTIKVGDGNLGALYGLSIYVWNEANAVLGALQGINVSLESDDGSIAGDVQGIRVGTPGVSGATISGKSAGIQIEDQTTNAVGGAFAIHYNAPSNKTFAVFANGNVLIKGNVGFYGTSPVARPEVPASPTAQDVVDALLALGLITQAAP